jgi:hypothetical protein
MTRQGPTATVRAPGFWQHRDAKPLTAHENARELPRAVGCGEHPWRRPDRAPRDVVAMELIDPAPPIHAGRVIPAADECRLRDDLPMLLPGIRVHTTPTDFFPLKQMHLQCFQGRQWVLFGDVIGG